MRLRKLRKHPILKTERLVLRELNIGDTEAVFRLRSNPKIMRYTNRPAIKFRREAQDFIQKNREGWKHRTMLTWAMTSKEQGLFVGCVGFWRIDESNHRAELGYLMLPEFHGQGLMHEAVSAVLAFAFDKIKVHSIEARVDSRNRLSRKVLERNEFVLEGRLRQDSLRGSVYRDTDVFGRLRS